MNNIQVVDDPDLIGSNVHANKSFSYNSFTSEKAIIGYDVPIAFIIFNRPDVTRQSFEALAAIRPQYLFLIADGPRVSRPGESEIVAQTRAIVKEIDWPCVVHVNFSEVNLGCKLRVSTGISWVFEHTDRAIILEDDCLPSRAFFSYCRDMLTLYENDKRVFSISGSNFSDSKDEIGHYFSRYALMWGWATWRDRWNMYQLDPEDFFRVVARVWWKRPVVLIYWLKVFQSQYAGKINTWDVQWILTLWRNNALACRPSVNLVKNIGFGDDATHTVNANSDLARLHTPDSDADLRTPLSAVTFDAQRDQIDEQRWALINIRSVLLMCFPWLGRLKQALS